MAELMNVRCAPAAPSALSLVAHLTTNTPAEFSEHREQIDPDSLLTTQAYEDYGGAKHQGGYQRCLHRTAMVAVMLQAGGQHGGGEGVGWSAEARVEGASVHTKGPYQGDQPRSWPEVLWLLILKNNNDTGVDVTYI